MENPYQPPQSEVAEQLRDPGVCPTCGGRDFREGTVRTRAMYDTYVFVPDSWPFLRLRQGLDMKSLACVDCGQVRDFIARNDLDALRRS